ncbi:MAG: hypothetical protein II971_04415 [Firmicutes bacterium]|nr:hypothetical protein [Bacillota bacterium]
MFAATGKGQTTETIGLFTKAAYLEMAEWRMWASIFCGFIGTILYYMGFHRMYGLLKLHVTEPKGQIWVRLFRAAYIMGTVAWAWVHAMFMTDALIFKFVFEAYGEVQTAADIANRVFYANAPGMLTAYIVCDLGLTIIMIAMVWKKKTYLPPWMWIFNPLTFKLLINMIGRLGSSAFMNGLACSNMSLGAIIIFAAWWISLNKREQRLR